MVARLQTHHGTALPGAAADGTGQLQTFSVDEALSLGLDLCWPVSGQERLQLHNALGRVLYHPVKSRHALPVSDCAAVDGYALRLDRLTGGGPWQLPLAGAPEAGAVEVLTGAPLPTDADAVVAHETVTRTDGHITLTARPEPGAGIRRQGSDIARGTLLAEAGRVIDPRIAAVLAAADTAQVTIRRRVLVALFCVGSDLRMPGERLLPGQVWNANRYHLTGVLTQPWVEVMDLGSIPDEPQALRTALDRATYAADLVITTGGIDNGIHDHLPATLTAMEAELHAMRLARRPGKPLLMARIGKSMHLGLPGNPVSTMIGWHVIGVPMLAMLAGLTRSDAAKTRRQIARAAFSLTSTPGDGEFLLGRLEGHDPDGMPLAQALQPEQGQRLALMAQAEGLIHIQPETTHVAPGNLVEFLPF